MTDDEIPPEAIDVIPQEKPKVGRRKDDHGFLPQINAVIAHYKAPLFLVVGVFAALGGKLIWPGDRIERLEANQYTVSKQLSRQDTINVFNVVISTGVATYVCMQATENEKRLMKLPCKQLLSGGSLEVPGLSSIGLDRFPLR